MQWHFECQEGLAACSEHNGGCKGPGQAAYSFTLQAYSRSQQCGNCTLPAVRMRSDPTFEGLIHNAHVGYVQQLSHCKIVMCTHMHSMHSGMCSRMRKINVVLTAIEVLAMGCFVHVGRVRFCLVLLYIYLNKATCPSQVPKAMAIVNPSREHITTAPIGS